MRERLDFFQAASLSSTHHLRLNSNRRKLTMRRAHVRPQPKQEAMPDTPSIEPKRGELCPDFEPTPEDTKTFRKVIDLLAGNLVRE